MGFVKYFFKVSNFNHNYRQNHQKSTTVFGCFDGAKTKTENMRVMKEIEQKENNEKIKELEEQLKQKKKIHTERKRNNNSERTIEIIEDKTNDIS